MGKRANLLLMHRDPTQTVDAYANIVKVVLGGRLVDPADLVANRKPSADPILASRLAFPYRGVGRRACHNLPELHLSTVRIGFQSVLRIGQ